ncbi:hypothetical protein RSK20926_21539 [Roseobacter sp. SK209-2-6]|uniref:PEP_CTERM-anchored TLD domain-containing protein n=1 Tax=Roseobacter sp. SK209-2-6 TaxID=388739 RepID=UPI0000F3F44E|nr:PEP_CTERM-anchored TLD domain-containing protein [Roseobacter sp. SK209-2-6]EBA16351.1 hypothetical protein RSK20926_21539 [Roseobacter sp. SK209-2-6]
MTKQIGKMKSLLVSLACTTLLGTAAQAGVVSGGSLLSGSEADQFETWLGLGDQDFTNIWTGTAGVSTAASFHAAVDGQGPTISIFDITMGDGSNARIGGYTALDWGGSSTYYNDPTAFLFNLTTGERQTTQHNLSSIYVHPNYFPTFGGGHDIVAGFGVLGTYNGNNSHPNHDGYSYSYTYDVGQGQISVAGDSGGGSGNSGNHYSHWSINTLEVYTFATASPIAPVPLPAGFPLLAGGLALLGFGANRRRRSAA